MRLPGTAETTVRRASLLAVLALLALCGAAAAQMRPQGATSGPAESAAQVGLARSCEARSGTMRAPERGVCGRGARQLSPAPTPTTGAVLIGLAGLDVIARPQVRRSTRSRIVIGAAAGLVLGAAGTHVLLHSGGSTSLCDREANQDAITRRDCIALTLGGGVAGAALGALVGWLTRPEE